MIDIGSRNDEVRHWRGSCPLVPSAQVRLLLVACLAIAGCGEPAEDRPAGDPSISSLPGVYSGQFPCVNCPGIFTTLWLRHDGRYFIRQQYLADENDEEMSAYGLGRWRWIEPDRTLVLAGDGPPRTFAEATPGTLIMRTDSDLEHRLSRDAQSPAFTASIRMTGTMHRAGKSTVFGECFTGLEAPVRTGGDYARFLHQYRRVAARNERVFVEFEGHFSWLPDGMPESLTIDRFVTIRERGACRSAD